MTKQEHAEQTAHLSEMVGEAATLNHIVIALHGRLMESLDHIQGNDDVKTEATIREHQRIAKGLGDKLKADSSALFRAACAIREAHMRGGASQ